MLNAGALPAAGCDLNKILLSTTKFDMTDERLICLFSSAPAQARAPAPAPALAPAAAPARRHRNPHPLADSPAQKHPTFHDHLLRTSHGHQSASKEMWVTCVRSVSPEPFFPCSESPESAPGLACFFFRPLGSLSAAYQSARQENRFWYTKACAESLFARLKEQKGV